MGCSAVGKVLMLMGREWYHSQDSEVHLHFEALITLSRVEIHFHLFTSTYRTLHSHTFASLSPSPFYLVLLPSPSYFHYSNFIILPPLLYLTTLPSSLYLHLLTFSPSPSHLHLSTFTFYLRPSTFTSLSVHTHHLHFILQLYSSTFIEPSASRLG